MATADLNSVDLVCRLTRDPELRSTAGGTPVCGLRVAWSTSRKDPQSGEWGTKPNYADVTVWGKQGENVARYCSKGKQIAVHGRLEWREWQDNDGNRRQVLEIVADMVQFLSGDAPSGGGSGEFRPASQSASDVPAGGDFAPAGSTAAPVDDDIPF